MRFSGVQMELETHVSVLRGMERGRRVQLPLTCVIPLAPVFNRELKHSTFLSHGRKPEV